MNENFLDALAVVYFLLGLENLQENREQSKHNDVQVANTKQSKILLNEINDNFKKMNDKLDLILEKLDKGGL